jgi:hypothetical protein
MQQRGRNRKLYRKGQLRLRCGRTHGCLAAVERRGYAIEVWRDGIGCYRFGLVGSFDGCGIEGGDPSVISGRRLHSSENVVHGKRLRIGETHPQQQRVDALLHLRRKGAAAQHEVGERLPEVGAHQLVGMPSLEVSAVTRKTRDPFAQPLQRVHGGTGTTRPLEGPRTIRGKISAVKQTSAWPAYLVAAACFAIALISSIANISLLDQLKQQQREVAHLSARSTALARNLTNERTALFDISDSHARHYETGNGEVIELGSRMYLAVHALPEPPRGKVYQCWTLAKGATRESASPTFLPDERGSAIVVLPADARSTADVSVTLEPDGGSREPTGKPLMDVSLGSH